VPQKNTEIEKEREREGRERERERERNDRNVGRNPTESENAPSDVCRSSARSIPEINSIVKGLN
jgi:hypothetical protein